MVNIFEYTDYRSYLRDIYTYLKRTTPYFSFRFFARAAGFKTPNYLKLVMEGKRNLSQEAILKFCKGLKLNRAQSEFFENLVHFCQAKTDEEKNVYYQRLSASKQYIALKEVEKDHYVYFSKWYFAAIRELAFFKNFREDHNWISQKLHREVTPKQVEEALELLTKLGLLKKVEGKLMPSDRNITTGPTLQPLVVANFQREMMKRASDSIEKTNAEYRDISTLTVALSQEKFLQIQKKINKFRQDLHACIATCEDPDSVYQINFQIFNLSEVPWTRKK